LVEERLMAGDAMGEKRVFVFVGCFQGVIDEVEVYRSESRARRAFKRYTGISYRDVMRAANDGQAPSAVLGQNLEDCRILEADLR
jgi:hypothetical protein